MSIFFPMITCVVIIMMAQWSMSFTFRIELGYGFSPKQRDRIYPPAPPCKKVLFTLLWVIIAIMILPPNAFDHLLLLFGEKYL